MQAEYLSALWKADIESIRRTKSGALAKDIYENKIVAERAYMQNSATRVVAFEMCGNDGLQNRSDFDGQTGTCSYTKLEAGTESCRTHVAKAMDYINANAYSGVKVKIISNLHYPGLDRYNKTSTCKDASTGKGVNVSEMMLGYAARVNWLMGDYARQKGFVYVDSFAMYHAADYDTNGDGLVDSEAIKYVPGESEASYVTRITKTLRSTIKGRQPEADHRRHDVRLHPVGRHAPDLHRRQRLDRPDRHGARARQHRATRRSPTARARSGTATPTSAPAGPCPSATRRRPEPSRSRR